MSCQNDKILSPEDFSFPQDSSVKHGRYNHERNAVLYLATSVKTCFQELRCPKHGFCSARVEVMRPIQVLDLTKMLNMDGHLLQSMVWSALLSSPNEDAVANGPNYVFSRFVADCAVEAGFQAIRYPSVRMGTGDNYVILDKALTQRGCLRISSPVKWNQYILNTLN